jgi:DNA-binding PadR family transcriptional regulator
MAPPQSLPIRGTRPHRELLTAWLLVLLESGASYGYDLRRELDARELSIDPSALYRALRKLERDGLVESRWMKAKTGPRRRFSRLTDSGREHLDEMAVVIRARRDVHDAFLAAHASARGARPEEATASETPAAEGAPPAGTAAPAQPR